MKFDLIFLLLIVLNHFILSDYEVYKNQFSIFFRREIKKINKEQNLGDEAINNLLYNKIYSQVNIGNNKIPTIIYLSFNNSDIKIISSSSIKNKEEKSLFTFPKSYQQLNLSYLSEVPNNDQNQNFSYLGLSLIHNDKNKYSFINQLKENKIIEKRIFSVLFKEKSITGDSVNDGQILFGLYPHEMTSRYNENDLKWVPIKDRDLWQIQFDEVKFNNEENSISIKEVEFDIGMNLIVGPEEYRIKIYENFFKKQIEDKLCKEEIFFNKKDNQFYITYSCSMDLEVNDFPTLSFYNKNLNYSIVLDYYQLLCIFERKIYFKVVFKKKAENKKWIFGRSFMEIYPLVFDVDNKKIGFYKVELSTDHPLILTFFFVVVIIIIIITIYRGNQMMKKENEEKEKKQKEEKEIKADLKKDENNLNIDKEKTKLKNE
jgi:hypothetical protein